MQDTPCLLLRGQWVLVERSLEVRLQIALVVVPHARPIDAQSNFDEHDNVGENVKGDRGRLMTHRQPGAAEQSHGYHNRPNYEQNQGHDPYNVRCKYSHFISVYIHNILRRQ